MRDRDIERLRKHLFNHPNLRQWEVAINIGIHETKLSKLLAGRDILNSSLREKIKLFLRNQCHAQSQN